MLGTRQNEHATPNAVSTTFEVLRDNKPPQKSFKNKQILCQYNAKTKNTKYRTSYSSMNRNDNKYHDNLYRAAKKHDLLSICQKREKQLVNSTFQDYCSVASI